MINTLRIVASAITVAALCWAAPASASPGSDDHGPTAPTPATHTPGMWHTQWEPTEHDTCPVELHESYAVTGPNGQTYDGWHPPTVTDPATGQPCTFGHEHGDDPETSDIYDWTVQNLGEQATGIAFGYASTQSEEAAADGGPLPHRHEDHVGHKMIVLNDVTLVREDRTGPAVDAEGEPISCDYLMKMHQGSHSKDALSNNAHELMYAARCSDGTEAVVTMLTPIGQPNEYEASCEPGRMVQTSGSELPPSDRGTRRIPDRECIEQTALTGPDQSADSWALYEVWEIDAQVTGSGGETIVRFDPWFGVRNPSRIGDGGTAVPSASLLGGNTVGWPWDGFSGPLEQDDPASPFNGAQRDSYVQNTSVDNAGGPRHWYTDAYGGNASRTPFRGSVRQVISQTSNGDLPALERRAFGFSTDYGAPETGVHAPN